MDMSKQCAALAKGLRANFTLNGNPVTYREVFSEVGLLPPIARRADQLCSLCFGYGLGVKFADEKRSTTGSRVSFDDATPNALRLLCFLDVLSELVYTAPSRDVTPLDELLYD